MKPFGPRQRMAELLNDVLAGSTSATDAIDEINQWPLTGPKDREINSALHLLQHYRDDEDIRSRDEEYAATQRRWLAEWVERLRR